MFCLRACVHISASAIQTFETINIFSERSEVCVLRYHLTYDFEYLKQSGIKSEFRVIGHLRDINSEKKKTPKFR